jgi:N-acetylmuramoyl-L-alanine amidase
MKFLIILFLILLCCFNNAKADEVNCLALNIYHEARNQPLVGKLAVAQVTMNRVKDVRFPNTICGVVYQGYYSNNFPIKNKCQFSWWCDGKSDKPKDLQSWKYSLMLARHMHEGFFDNIDVVKDATHYHAVYVTPYWINKKRKIRTIADHVFYQWEK